MGKLGESDRNAVLDIALRENVTSAIKSAEKHSPSNAYKRLSAFF